MKKISQIFSNYQKNSNIDSNEVNKKYFESLKKETEEYNEESMEESETNPTMNENEIIYPNDVQSTNITKPNYQLKEQNLEFGIIQCSSNQGTFSPFKLSVNNIDKKYKTWISSENCQYPQYITLKLINGECYIDTIQILFHQYYIPSKVEIFIGNCIKMPNMENNMKHEDCEKLLKSFVAIEFERIGYFTLYNNQNVNSTTRELKLIKIDKNAQYIKLVVYECYKNQSNVNNQVGIVSVKVNGIPIATEKIDKNIITEEKVNNRKIKKSNQQLMTPNNGIKKSENITPKQNNITNIQDVVESPDVITEDNYIDESINEKQNITVNNDNVISKIKNIKSKNLTVGNEDTSNTDISEEKNEVITKDTIMSTYSSPTRKNNTMNDTVGIGENDDNNSDSSSSVIDVSLSSVSNVINKNIITDRRNINVSPSKVTNRKNFTKPKTSNNKDSNQLSDNINNYISNNLADIKSLTNILEIEILKEKN